TTTDRTRYSRHHTQMAATVDLGGGAVLDLNKAHVPTGWVTFEEVIRFVIHDLGVKPPCGDEAWPGLLEDSERKFHEEFSGRDYRD
ncbi:MAG TPA: hypothetical protein VMF14_23290, partial [Solirubrobacteraceae bacterium]|nr:hypothetical protein [Solirubrobacteraceae bacterium]